MVVPHHIKKTVAKSSSAIFRGSAREVLAKHNYLKNTWIVNFRGNEDTRKDRTVDLSLLRSAELTLENGFNYFVVAESGTDIRTETYVMSLPGQPATAGTSIEPTSSNTVVMFKKGNYILKSVDP